MEEKELTEKIAELREKRSSSASQEPPEEEEEMPDFRSDYRRKQSQTSQEDVLRSGGFDENGRKPKRKDDGIWGTLTVQSILAVLLAITYVVTMTFSPGTARNALTLIQDKAAHDFSFRDQVYDTITSVITYLSTLDVSGNLTSDGESSSRISSEAPSSDPTENTADTSSDSALQTTSAAENSGMGGDYTPTDSFQLPPNCTMAPVIYTGSALFPIAGGGTITSFFGFRDHPTNGASEFHKAVDIAAPQGTNILAAFDGTVVESGFDPELGNYIILDHGREFTTTYAHCERRIAQVGMRIRQGEVIALVGSTGDSTGFHLHFAMKLEGLYFNPAYIFPKELHAAV